MPLLLIAQGTPEKRANNMDPAFRNYQLLYYQELAKYDSIPQLKKDTIIYVYDKVIANESFDKQFEKILSTVVIGNNELSPNGTSFAFTQASDKTTLAASAVVWVSPLVNHAFKTSINTVSQDGDYSIYSDGAWSKKVGLNLTYTRVISKSAFFDLSDAKKLLAPRKQYAFLKMDSLYTVGLENTALLETLITSTPKYETVIPDDLNSLPDVSASQKQYSLKIQQTKEELLKAEDELSKNLQIIYDQETDDQYEGVIKKVDSLRGAIAGHKKDIAKLQELRSVHNERVDSLIAAKSRAQKTHDLLNYDSVAESRLDAIAMKKFIENELSAFDSKNFTIKNYSLHWLDFTAGVSNNEYNLRDSILELLPSIEKVERRAVYDVGASYNYTSSTQKYLQYAQIGFKVSIGSFLDNPALQIQDPKVARLGNPIFRKNARVLDSDDNLVGFYNNLDDTASYMSIDGNYNIFFTKNKSIGMSVRGALDFIIDEPRISNSETYTLMVGPQFRSIKEAVFSKGVFGLQAGVEYMPGKGNIGDFFTARLTVGIPFEVFSNK
jgi:hypothetical protein